MCFFILLGGLTVSCWPPALRTGAWPRVSPASRLVLSWQLCEQMALGSLGLGFLLALPLTTLICLLPFCGHDDIYHFFCDTPAVMRPACADARGHQAASVPLAWPLQPPLPPDPLPNPPLRFLLILSHGRSEDGVSPGRAQGLLHLPLPPHRGSPAVRLLTYLRPSASSSPGRRPGGVCGLHLFLTTAEPLDLKHKESRGDSGSENTYGKNLLIRGTRNSPS